MANIDEIKSKIRIEDLVSETATVKLRKSGASWVGFCPFHGNHDTPALVVWANGSWKCFGTCNEGGDIFHWVMKKNPGWDFKEALRYLAERAGVKLQEDNSSLQGRSSARVSANIKKAAQDVFQRWLVGVTEKDGTVSRAPDAEALAYAMDRGWTLETIKAEGVGFSGRATAAEYNEMRGEFNMRGIDLLAPEAVMVMGFKGDLKKWATDQNLDPSVFSGDYIQGLMATPGLIYAHKFDGVIEYPSGRFLPEWEKKRGRKSDNPNANLSGKKRAYRNSLYRHHHLDGKEKGALLYIVEGQGDAVTFRQAGLPAVALCGSQWKPLVDSGEVADWLKDYEELIYVTDADEPGENVVTGKNNDFAMANALGSMLWVGRTENKTWMRPDGTEKTIKDVNDIAQYLMDTKADEKESNRIFNAISMKAERIVVLAAQYAGSLSGNPHESMLEKILKPMILSIPTDKRGATLERDIAVALYPNIAKTTAASDFNKWLKRQEKAVANAAKNEEDEDQVSEKETLGGYFRNPADPTQGWLVDLVYDLATQKAALAYRNDKGEIGVAKQLDIYGVRYYPKVDDFVRKGIVVFPSDLGPLMSTRELLKIHEDQHRASVLFDKSTDYAMAAYYSLFTWVYDCFNELPFLRARGGKDTGKSAIMLRIGYVCYRLAKSTGIGSTASLKHAQELYKCTVFFDEMDIADKFDERIVMMNVRAMKDQAYVWSMKAVTDINGDQNYEPQAHNVYGPALITMYGSFSDEATDSRCITFDLFGKDVSELKKHGIPRRLSSTWHAEALRIRNMNLHWRLKNWKPDLEIPDELEDEMVSTRANQVTVPIKFIVKDDAAALAEVTATVREMYADEILAKAQSFEARFLEAIIVLTESPRFAPLEFVHDADMKEHGKAKYIRYPDLAKVTNFLLDEMNSGISKDIESILRKPDSDRAEDVGGKDEKGKKKKKEDAGVSTKTVGDNMRKFQLPIKRLGAGYVVIVWSQSKPDEVQGRVARLKKRFGLDLLNDGDAATNAPAPVRMSATAAFVPDEPDMPEMNDEQMDMYSQMAENEE